MRIDRRHRTLAATAFCALALAVGAYAGEASLAEALKQRDRAAVSELLQRGGDAINAALPDGSTPLAWAVHLQDLEAARSLLRAGAEVNTADTYGDTPLTLACANGDGPMAMALLEAGADPTVSRWNGETPLMLAAGTGLTDAVRLMLSRGADPDARENGRGQTALMWAASDGHPETAAALAEARATLDIASKQGFTALMFAVTRNDLESMRTLLEAGADPNTVAYDGSQPANIAAAYGHSDALGLLLGSNAAASTPDKAGQTPLYLAARAGDAKAVEMLLAAGADPNLHTHPIDDLGADRDLRRSDAEDTPLLAAALEGHLGVMKMLVAAGANTKARTQDGLTLLMRAVRSAQMPVVQYAYTLDNDLAAKTSIGRTVMHASVMLTSFRATEDEICEIIRFLADEGADPDPIDAGGRTAISTADVWPMEKASMLLYEITVAAGRQPKILPTNLR